MTPPRKRRRPRKPRGGVSRSGCRRIDKILVWTPIRPEVPCRSQEAEE
jgi:hypothetical protein